MADRDISNRSGCRRRDDERGTALVEFSISAALLLVLLFGIASYGYMLSFKQGLTQAAAEGARAAAVGSDVNNAVARSVGAFHQTCNTGGLTCQGNTTAWPPVQYDCGDHVHQCVTVKLTYDYQHHPLMPQFPGLGLVMPGTLTSTYVVEVS
ncbi:MAG TPA: TadE/TadG family type IV pilus assembly protein [Acidimicrobiia bacterium]|nr:TadE/TadG family type IV pilus assembly protein [Acidimicrobiia bacterium]